MSPELGDSSLNLRKNNEFIRVRGARVHNLKNVDLDLHRNQFVVITGPSGSGKSTLAFDTLFAEGQRQYVESLSVYARQFMNQLQRPDVDSIEGLPPTICINQRSGAMGRRSTVATVTEIYDYLRLLYAKVGVAHCYRCEQAIQQQNPEQIQESIVSMPEGTKLMLMAPMVRGKKGSHKEVFAKIRKAGLIRVRVNNQVYDLENRPELSPRKSHQIDAVIDRIMVREGVHGRISESIRLALSQSGGLVVACYQTPEMQSSGSPEWKNDLYSTLYACTHCNISLEEVEPRTFSFNSPYGACPVCDGLGAVEEFDPELVLSDPSLSLEKGAVIPWKNLKPAAAKKIQKELSSVFVKYGFTWQTPLNQLGDPQIHELIHGDDDAFLGVLMLLEKELATTMSKKRQSELEMYRDHISCRVCRGARLRIEALHVRFHDMSIHEITSISIKKCLAFFQTIEFSTAEKPVAEPLIIEIQRRLKFLQKVGVSYLALNRPADSLSGGELQRVRLATSIGSGLVGACYILDEPSIGLHARDNRRLIAALRELQRLGNSVLVVEHDEAMMREADHIVDMGPNAGKLGGQIVAAGTLPEISREEDSITGAFLAGTRTIPLPTRVRRTAKSRSLSIESATANNLKNINVMFPLQSFVCVTGVSGSGKSTLVNETLAPAVTRRLGGLAPKPAAHKSLRGVRQIDKVVQIDQAPIGRTARSNPATYVGVFDEIRKVFAGTKESKQRGYGIGRFSFNVAGGRCEGCQGQGNKKIEMNFLPDLFVTCDECRGARFNRQTLRVKYRGRSIADVLNMSVDEAVDFFENFASVARILQTLQDVGLGYLPLGQPSTTLSGGEAQRIKLATELARAETGKTLYLLDEPTTGLHFVDIEKLLIVLNRLVDKGNSVIVIEHNLDVIKSADWLIDLGPDGGDEGGHIVATGTPEHVANIPESYTGQSLRLLFAQNGRQRA